jgi:rhamnose utilization protein RhaD (predicted bifunctional aldolase and dehydrogenase)
MIDQLVKISRYYGRQKGYALGGGGNTSYKNKEKLWVKASGYSLADISAKGFAVLSRKSLAGISFKKYSLDSSIREQQVKDDLIAASVYPGMNLRPSVEASLHDLIGYSFVVHTHPYLVNAVTCSRSAKKTILKLFGEKALFIPYVDPGYILFKKIEGDLIQFKRKYKRHPSIIFLQNHGVFVGGETTAEIRSTYDLILQKIKKSIKNDLNISGRSSRFRIPEALTKAFQEFNGDSTMVFKSRNNSLIRYYTDNPSNKRFISKPFIPDQIVYCRSIPLWLKSADKNSPGMIEKKLDSYRKKYGYTPRIILIQNEGIIGIEINEMSADLVLDVFEDAMKIGYFSHNFGGPHFMSKRQITFIENWEVENYRRNLLVK